MMIELCPYYDDKTSISGCINCTYCPFCDDKDAGGVSVNCNNCIFMEKDITYPAVFDSNNGELTINPLVR